MSRFLAAFFLASFAVACSSSSEDEPAVASDDQAISDGSLTVACQTLGRFDSCNAVAFCKEKSDSSCAAKESALASSPDWKRICEGMAGNQQACGWQSNWCEWRESRQCLPLGNVVTSDAQSGGDPIAVTCRTLGELGQCGASNLCKTKSEASCKAKPAVAASEPKWQQLCNNAGVNEQACGWQSNWCVWESTTTCIGR